MSRDDHSLLQQPRCVRLRKQGWSNQSGRAAGARKDARAERGSPWRAFSVPQGLQLLSQAHVHTKLQWATVVEQVD